jgi:hypothetical protein
MSPLVVYCSIPWILLTAQLPSAASAFDSVLAGEVIDDLGKPLANISVKTNPAGGGVLVEKLTDSDGKFTFDVVAGYHAVSVDAPGYLISDNAATVTQGASVFRTIHAFRATSTVVVHVNLPETPSNLPFFVSAGSRINNSLLTGIASEVSIDNRTTKFSLYPGYWRFECFVRTGGVDQRQVQFASVSEGSQDLTFDFVSGVQTSNIRGRTIDEFGASVALTRGFAFARNASVRSELTDDGSFQFGVLNGKWSLLLFTSTNPESELASGYSAYTEEFEVADNSQLDVGEVQMPTRSANVTIRLRAPGDVTPAFQYGITAYATRTVNGIKYTSYHSSRTGDIDLPLTPGKWEISFSNPQNGFANIQPITIDVPPGSSTHSVTLDLAALTLTSPRFSISAEPGGKPRPRLHVERGRIVIESSTDLKAWKFLQERYPSQGYIDILEDTVTTPVQHFRAIEIEE